jgi:hypothetical protein
MTAEMTQERQGLILCSEEELAGFMSPGSYDRESTNDLLALHREIAAEFQVGSPYWKFAGKEEKLHFRKLLDEKSELYIVAGRLGSFSEEELAVFFQEQARNYVHRDTMGIGFPRGDEKVERELLGLFLDGFKEDDVLIMVRSERTGDKIEIVGGARIVRGSGDQPLSTSLVKGEHPVSTLPTAAALQIKEDFEEPQLDLAVTEEMSVCITRYWTQGRNMARRMDLPIRVAPHIIAAMPIAYTLDAVNNGGVNNIPQRAIFDTHHRSIIEFTKSNFNARVIADNGHVEATPEVMSTVLKYHYGGKAYGGYGDEIFIGMFDTQNFLDGALKYFEGLGINF